ncbi:sigma-54-dependent transcriptional regulator [Cellvibrio polysaccharolyticus]|uniref:Sigma-54-dependent Fis family transcriptional regulator n=1 Tax=Cellvibrio polysaccharolyticus TaxID=2082724 RepID=A0A928V1A3_9GAMM|nr:sigma-54 dependent transcriptional regulator [Cellvibrio polysaccharolyticus]MBE8715953.1 sigma-54-dependent Fis family transcriptional regulator [Cellvibrio polysaccharolyticus]
MFNTQTGLTQKVLIIDDNPAVANALQLLLSVHDIDAEIALTPQAGVKRLENDDRIALVIQDMNFTEDTTSGQEGQVLFYQIRQVRPDIPVILTTAWTQLETAIALVKSGAADYLAKPWDDVKLVTTIKNLLELEDLQQQQRKQAIALNNEKLQISETADLCGLVYQSTAMHALVSLAVKIARSDVPVLITGPNGAGKEKIARILQANSRVKSGPFICVNVGALPGELIEAELFGAEAGAYTGISKMRIGRFEAADGGTLFLDELGNLSASGQAKLLRVLQTGEFERLGSSQTRRCYVRVISATNANLQHAMERGEFREDLFYRLNVFELKVPALAERKEDILPLAHHFLGQQVLLDHAVIRALRSYHWPGNIRELENACQRALILGDGRKLNLEDFGIPVNETAGEHRSVVISEPSKEMIESILRQNHGVVAQAARQLGFSRQALYRRLEKYNIELN